MIVVGIRKKIIKKKIKRNIKFRKIRKNRSITYSNIFFNDSILRFHKFESWLRLFGLYRLNFSPYFKLCISKKSFFYPYRMLYSYFKRLNSVVYSF